MYVKIVTTITTEVDLDTMESEHSVSIDAAETPSVIAYAAAAGGCKSTLITLAQQNPRLFDAETIAGLAADLEESARPTTDPAMRAEVEAAGATVDES